MIAKVAGVSRVNGLRLRGAENETERKEGGAGMTDPALPVAIIF
jgi:hypothetical protein